MWHWRETFSQRVAFCVWILQVDGLRVPPFVFHPAGDERLRGLGLDAANWRAWIEATVRAEDSLSEFLTLNDVRRLTSGQRAEIAALDDKREPPRLWPGKSTLRSALEELWPRYEPIGEDWVRRVSGMKRQSRLSPTEERRLWRELQPFRRGLTSLQVYPIDYAAPITLPVPPVSCVIAVGPHDPGGRIYADNVIRAARELTVLQAK